MRRVARAKGRWRRYSRAGVQYPIQNVGLRVVRISMCLRNNKLYMCVCVCVCVCVCHRAVVVRGRYPW